MATRRAEIDRVQVIIDGELGRYATRDAQGRSVAPIVSALHERAELIRSAEVARIGAVLARLSEDDRAAVESVTRRIVAKLVHEPTVQAESAAGSPAASASPRRCAASALAAVDRPGAGRGALPRGSE